MPAKTGEREEKQAVGRIDKLSKILGPALIVALGGLMGGRMGAEGRAEFTFRQYIARLGKWLAVLLKQAPNRRWARQFASVNGEKPLIESNTKLLTRKGIS